MKNNDNLAKIAINKSLLKEYSNSSNERIVYMDDNTEFQIQLFNPYTYTIGISFDFNSQSGCSQLLVLKPGERVWLDRFLDSESKFLFSTYEVGTSKKVKEAIKDNGKLCIRFYKERQYHNNNIWVSNPITYTVYDYSTFKPYSEYTTLTNGDINCVNSAMNSITVNDSPYGVSSYTSTAYCNDITNLSYDTKLTNFKTSIETGRIEKGNHSNQKFEHVNKDFESWAFKTEYIKILPTSQKPIRSNDLKKRYCHNCGRKLNQKYIYCPFCGTKQE